MRVKVGNTWYDSQEQPICIQVNEIEQKQIGDIDRSVAPKGKYASFPSELGWSVEEMREFMKDSE